MLMFDLEQRAHDGLATKGSRRRFRWLLQNRNHLAQVVSELYCWGVADTPAIDKQLALLEDRLTDLVSDADLVVQLLSEWAVRDAALLHRGGRPDRCAVCRDGRYGLESLLARFPEYDL